MSWLSRLSAGLSKTTTQAAREVGRWVGLAPTLSATDAAGLEDALLLADCGPAAAARLVQIVKDEQTKGEAPAAALHRALLAELTPLAPTGPLLPEPLPARPYVILIAGVNGSGKTTTIGKLAAQWQAQGRKVMVAAADTFRAAAAPQLQVWAERAGATFFQGAQNADPASVAYAALAEATRQNIDVLLIDTAGRLPNRPDLLEELKKIPRVLAKLQPTAPHAAWLVLDATLGQATVPQVQAFAQALTLTGLVVTKLDGTAKAGFLIPLAKTCPLPVVAVGVGEGVDDLGPFHPATLATALSGQTF